MKIRSWKSLRGVAVAVCAIVALAALTGVTQASNMGFKMNRSVAAAGATPNVGLNQVALPALNPYVNASDICAALNLTANVATVAQINPQTGVPSQITCNQGSFVLTQNRGVIVRNGGSSTSGIIVGSHQPGMQITLYPVGANPNLGSNLFPVPYHTTAVSSKDLCNQMGVSNATTVSRVDATTGVPAQSTCSDVGGFGLVLGEAVTIRPPAQIMFTPSHF
jgi:hypothetical protein